MKKVPDGMTICREVSEVKTGELGISIHALQGAVFERACFDLDYVQNTHSVVQSAVSWFRDEEFEGGFTYAEVLQTLCLRQWMLTELELRIKEAEEFLLAFKECRVLDKPFDKQAFAHSHEHWVGKKYRPFARYIA